MVEPSVATKPVKIRPLLKGCSFSLPTLNSKTSPPLWRSVSFSSGYSSFSTASRLAEPQLPALPSKEHYREHGNRSTTPDSGIMVISCKETATDEHEPIDITAIVASALSVRLLDLIDSNLSSTS